MFYAGWGVRQDYTLAIEWYRKAAAQGLAEGQYWFGLAHPAGGAWHTTTLSRPSGIARPLTKVM